MRWLLGTRMYLVSTLSNFFVEDFHYCNLATQSGIKIGIADAKEMGVEPDDRSNNTVILQFEVEDLEGKPCWVVDKNCL